MKYIGYRTHKSYSENRIGNHRNRIDPQGTMVKTKGSKTFAKDICKAIYDLSCCGLRHEAIVEYYKLKPSTVSNVIRIQRVQRAYNGIAKKRGRKQKLSHRSLHQFWRCVVQNCCEPFCVIVALFSADTKIQLSESTDRRYLKQMNIQCYIAIQKSFLSKKNMTARIQWALTDKNGRSPNVRKLCLQIILLFCTSEENSAISKAFKGPRYSQKHIEPTFKSGCQTISVWGGFSSRGRTLLVGTVDSFAKILSSHH